MCQPEPGWIDLILEQGTINTVRPHPVHTPVENMMQRSDIPKTAALFTAYLTNHIDGVPPCYTFGYIDQVRSCRLSQ